jgi:DNA polymerase delta subunit 1
VIGGDHTRTKAVVTSRVGALSAFTRRKETCLGCKAVLSEVGTPLCKHCAPDEARLYQQELTRFTALEDRFCRLWTQCQRCQGSLHEEVLCTRSVIVFLLCNFVVASEIQEKGMRIDKIMQSAITIERKVVIALL